MESTLKQTYSAFTCIGVVSEINLEQSTITIDAGPKGDKKKIDTNLISGPVSIRTSSGIVDFYIYVTEIGYNGKDNFQWKMAQAMLNWNPLINGNGEAPTRVCINGRLNPRDYPDKQTNEHRYKLGYQITSANTRVSEDDADGMTIKLNGYIDSIKPEKKDEEETGRLNLRILGATYDGQVYPIDVIVDEEAVELIEEGDEDFEAFEAGQTRTNIELEFVSIDGGNEVEEEQGHKRRLKKSHGPEVRTNRGSRKEELHIVSVDDRAVEEPDELTYEDDEGNIKETETLWLNPATIKAAKKVRATMIEEMNRGEAKKSTPSLKERKAAKKAEKAKSHKAYVEDDDFDDDPF